ncbi:methyltransferase domain-containing protein [Halomonas sp. SCS19]|uniref:methyltransferase domain-containing protein n=1 Tax=Halomonas sp. SCS19 TaxID=2950870 RepID=UPI0032DF3A92
MNAPLVQRQLEPARSSDTATAAPDQRGVSAAPDATPGDWQRRVARAFSRAAPRYRELARAQMAMAETLWPHLPDHAERILDLGCGPGDLTRGLAERYPDASVLGLDLSAAMLAQARQTLVQQTPARPAQDDRGTEPRRQEASPHPRATACAWVCADAQALPLADASLDLAISNLAIQWCPDLEQVLAELHRVLAPGGRAVLNTLLPGTLAEIGQVWRQPGKASGVLDFASLDDHRRAVRSRRWAATAFEQRAERFYYPDLDAVMASVKGVGAQVARPGARLSRQDIRQARARYEHLRRPEGLPVTYQRLTLILDR